MKTEPKVAEWVGQTLDGPPGDIACERGYILNWLEATENANPLHWDERVAEELTGGWIAPPSMLSTWMRPLTWKPGRAQILRPLELHFRLKEAFDLPDGIVGSNGMILHAPVRLGDRVRTAESVREISEPTEKRLGTGRFWTIDVTYRNQHDEVVGIEWYRMFSYAGGGGGSGKRAEAPPPDGGSLKGWNERSMPERLGDERLHASGVKPGDALPVLEVPVTARTVIIGAAASRDWQPQHHDHHWIRNRVGTKDIFLNTPNQAGWIERYLTDWTGPTGRLGSLTFRMRRSICDGDLVTFTGTVSDVSTDDRGCTWAGVDVELKVGEETATACAARVAIPASEDDNPWRRTGDDWAPDPD